MSTETEHFAKPRPKRIVVCMDGTWNSPAVVHLRDDGDEVFKPSNVLKTARAVKNLDDTLAVLAFDGQPIPGETVTLGGKTYTFVDELDDDRDGSVHIGASAGKSLENLAYAVDQKNHRGRYSSGTIKNERITARKVPGRSGGIEFLPRDPRSSREETLRFACGVAHGRLIGPDPLVEEAQKRGLDPLEGIPQLSYYDSGVGGSRTFSGAANQVHRVIDRTFGGARGAGFEANVEDAYLFLSLNFNPRDELYFFGFSRGAASARSLARFVDWTGGVIPSRDSYWIPRIFDSFLQGEPSGKVLAEIRERVRKRLLKKKGYDEERARNEAAESMIPYAAPIHFLGVWDTVLSLGKKRDLVHLGEAPPASVERAYQALAIDERRADFLPRIWKRPAHKHQRLVQRWFPGVHTNIGGGYLRDGLGNISLRFLLQGAREAGLGIDWTFLKAYRPYEQDQLYDSQGTTWKVLETARFRWGKGVRKIENDPEAGLTVDPSALVRLGSLKHENGREHKRFEEYRPENLLRFLGEQENLDAYLLEILGTDGDPESMARIRQAVAASDTAKG